MPASAEGHLQAKPRGSNSTGSTWGTQNDPGRRVQAVSASSLEKTSGPMNILQSICLLSCVPETPLWDGPAAGAINPMVHLHGTALPDHGLQMLPGLREGTGSRFPAKLPWFRQAKEEE